MCVCVRTSVAATSPSCLLKAENQPLQSATPSCVESLSGIWVQESCGIQTSTGKVPLTTAGQLCAWSRLSCECGNDVWPYWINSVCCDLHPFPAYNRRLVCDVWQRKRPRESWWSVVCSVWRQWDRHVMSPLEDLPSEYVRCSGDNTKRIRLLLILPFFTSIPLLRPILFVESMESRRPC